MTDSRPSPVAGARAARRVDPEGLDGVIYYARPPARSRTRPRSTGPLAAPAGGMIEIGPHGAALPDEMDAPVMVEWEQTARIDLRVMMSDDPSALVDWMPTELIILGPVEEEAPPPPRPSLPPLPPPPPPAALDEPVGIDAPPVPARPLTPAAAAPAVGARSSEREAPPTYGEEDDEADAPTVADYFLGRSSAPRPAPQPMAAQAASADNRPMAARTSPPPIDPGMFEPPSEQRAPAPAPAPPAPAPAPPAPAPAPPAPAPAPPPPEPVAVIGSPPPFARAAETLVPLSAPDGDEMGDAFHPSHPGQPSHLGRAVLPPTRPPAEPSGQPLVPRAKPYVGPVTRWAPATNARRTQQRPPPSFAPNAGSGPTSNPVWRAERAQWGTARVEQPWSAPATPTGVPRDWATPSFVSPRWSEPSSLEMSSGTPVGVAGVDHGLEAALAAARERDGSPGLRALAAFGAVVLVMSSLLVSATIIAVGVGYTLTFGSTFEAIAPAPVSTGAGSTGAGGALPLAVDLSDGSPDPAAFARLLDAVDACAGRITIDSPGGSLEAEALSMRIAAAGIPADRIEIEVGNIEIGNEAEIEAGLGRQDGRVIVACSQ